MERPQAEMVKNMAFILRTPEEVLRDDFWTISEALCFYAWQLRNDQEGSEYDEYYRLLYVLVMAGIERNEIIPIEGMFKKKNMLCQLLYPQPIKFF